jgi:hypothetical protein
MKLVALVAGVVLVLLGALWTLQGLGIVTMAPILCFADCMPVTGPSILWAIIGLLSIVAGGALVAWARGRRPPV